MTESQLDLVVAGTSDAVLMVESEAKELSEDVMLGAVMFGHRHFQPVIDLIIDLAEACAKDPWELEFEDHSAVYDKVASVGETALRQAYDEPVKQARHERVEAVRAQVLEAFADDEDADATIVMGQFKKLEKSIVRGAMSAAAAIRP